MKKILSFTIGFFAVALSVLIISSAVSNDAGFVNSDIEYYSPSLSYFVDDGLIYSETDLGENVQLVSASNVNTFGVYDGRLFASSDNRIIEIDKNSGEWDEIVSSKSEIGYFSIFDECIFYLSSGDLISYSLKNSESLSVISSRNITKFWFKDNSLIYFTSSDGNNYSYDLEDFSVDEIELCESSFGDSIPVVPPKDIDSYFPLLSSSVSSLQDKFPSGKYWNHANNPGSGNNNQNGYTSIPCPDHGGTIGTDKQTCNGFAPQGSQVSWQCMGYAEKCAYDVSGLNPRSNSNGWLTTSAYSALDELKAGDVVRYRNNGHSIYVTGVRGDTVTFTDCNYDGKCGIRWYRTIEKSTLKASFSYVRKAPSGADSVFGDNTPGSVTITFNANEGTVSTKTMTIQSGSAPGHLPEPLRTYFTFDGWYTDPSGGEIFTSSTVVDENITVYAHWIQLKYSVYYDANGGEGAPLAQSCDEGKSCVLSNTKPKRTGYNFVCWNTEADGSGRKFNPGDKYTDKSSLVLYAIWNAKEYTLKFDANGGSCNPSSIKIKFGSKLGDLPVPVRANYNFEGWYTSADAGELVSPDDIYASEKSISIYAHWTEIVYMIDYDGNGYTHEKNSEKLPETQIKQKGRSVTLKMNQLSMAGAEFVGWNTDPNGNGKYYNSGDRYSDDESITLYAIWDRVKYEVAFDYMGGSDGPNTMYKSHGLPLSIPDDKPVRDGYVFSSWNARSDGKGERYLPNDVYYENKPITLFAMWSGKQFNVSFNACGGTASFYQGIYSYGSKYSSLPDASKEGYNFTGWYTSETDGNIINSSDIVSITSDSTFYAHWAVKVSRITLDSDGGLIDTSSIDVEYGSTYAALPVPEKPGYVFAGWFTSSDKQIFNDSVMRETSDFTLYAKYVPAYFTIYLNPNGGVCNKKYITVQYDDIVPEIPQPGRSGYEFLGWYDGENKFSTSKYNLKSDVVLKAKWTDESGNPAEDIEELIEYGSIHYAVFIADGKTFGYVPYTVSNSSIDEPEFPSKDGFVGKWSSYNLDYSSECMPVLAKYVPIEYDAVFYIDGVEYRRVKYTVEDEKLNEPVVKQKDKYIGKWENYTIVPGGMRINAVYTPESMPKFFFSNPNLNGKAPYNSTVFIEAETSFDLDNTEIKWYINDEYYSSGNSCEIKEVKTDFKVYAELYYCGNPVQRTEEKSITVNTGILQRIIAFFRSLFGKVHVEKL